MNKQMPISEVRKNLPKLLKRLQKNPQEKIAITVHGIVVGQLILPPKATPQIQPGHTFFEAMAHARDTTELSIKELNRITFDPSVMGGKPCIRGMRVTVGMVVGMIATGHSKHKILKLYPYLESADIDAALSYATWRSEERELPL